jgi:uncharacterized membrane protein (UPF0127 family)
MPVLPPADEFLDPLLRHGRRSAFRLENQRNGQSLAGCVLTAFDSSSRRRGLLGQSGFEPGTALIIAPSSAIHTWFMRFEIDVAFVARDGRIVKTCRSLRPWRLAVAPGARSVVELPAETLIRTGTVAGDRLALLGF